MAKKINVGLIGVGRLGKIYLGHLKYSVPEANLVAIADVEHGVAESLAKEYDVPKWYEKSEDLIADKDIEAVVIITPTKTHSEVVIEAAKAGKAIFCEKPISLSLEEAENMVEVTEKAGAFFQMGFMRRFDKGYMAAKEKIDNGLIGKPVVLKSSSRDPYRTSLEFANPKNSGGMIMDMGAHDFDIARWFMGEVKSVFSITGTLAYPELNTVGDIDNAIVSLSFENETLGVVDLSRNGVYGYDIRTEILGTEGTLKIGYLRETPLLIMKKEGITHDTVPYFMERFGDAYLTQLKDFIDNLLNDKPPAITGKDAIATLKIGIAATLSQKQATQVEIKSI